MEQIKLVQIEANSADLEIVRSSYQSGQTIDETKMAFIVSIKNGLATVQDQLDKKSTWSNSSRFMAIALIAVFKTGAFLLAAWVELQAVVHR